MLIIHGTYHWRPRRTAFRNDYCRSCEAERLSVLIRTFDVLHVFWIPLLPLGLWSRWFCTHCGSRPHAAVHTRRGFKIAGVLALALFALVVWAVPAQEVKDDAWIIWVLRPGLPLAAVALAVSTLRQPREPNFSQRLAAVTPYEGWDCPLCGGQLFNVPKWHCPNCGAEHRPLAGRAA
jgi:hypothetical protein